MKPFAEIEKAVKEALKSSVPKQGELLTGEQYLDQMSKKMALSLWNAGCLCPIQKEI